MGVPKYVREEMERLCKLLNIDCRLIILESMKLLVYAGEASMTPNGNIVVKLNEYLFDDPEVMKAVVTHELVHVALRSPNHDDRFYSLLYMVVPESEYLRLMRRAEDIILEKRKRGELNT